MFLLTFVSLLSLLVRRVATRAVAILSSPSLLVLLLDRLLDQTLPHGPLPRVVTRAVVLRLQSLILVSVKGWTICILMP